jgi:hypothetical protein
MKVRDLLKILSQTNPSFEVCAYSEGAIRVYPEFAWHTKNNELVLCAENQTVYDEDERPVMAPTAKEELYWRTTEYKDGMNRLL